MLNQREPTRCAPIRSSRAPRACGRASGDLVPLSYVAGSIPGLDKAYLVDLGGETLDSHSALARLGYAPLTLEPKKGLALNNGTGACTGVAANACARAFDLTSLALAIHALFAQALLATDQSFQPFVHAVKPHPGQVWTAGRMAELLAGSKVIRDERRGDRRERAGKLIQDRCREPSWRGLIDSWCKIAFLQRHHPSAEQLDTGAAIHGSLEGLQSVDLSFGLPVAPGLRHGVPHRLQVLAYCLRKTLHRIDPRRARIDQPTVQPLRHSTAKQASKPHRQAPHCCELGGRRFQRIYVGDLPGRHLAAGFDAERRRGQRRDHPTGHWIQRSHMDRGWLLLLVTLEGRFAAAPGCKETRQMTEGPGIATVAYLGEQVPDFGNAFGPSPLKQNAEIRRGGRG
jgi:hypothetical protein